MIGDVSHFIIYINETSAMNVSNNINETLTLVTYSVLGCYCASHNVSVQAVNRCGRHGESTPYITLLALDSESQSCNDNLASERGELQLFYPS